jgi:hypothetical protein
MSRRSTRVVSVSSASNSRTTSKPKNSTLYRAYKSVFGPSNSKLANIAQIRSSIEEYDRTINNFIDHNIPDIYGVVLTALNDRNTRYHSLMKLIRPTPEDIAAEKAIRARIREYQKSQGSQFVIAEGRTRKRRKHRKHKKH